ncbi:MAG: hypothetical protein V1696_01750 [Candidatus Jorgensenbacteria bacterium]
MEIAMINRDHKLWEGGDRRKIENLIAALQKMGVNAFYTCDNEINFKADVYHLFHMSYETAYKAFLNIKKKKLKLVVSAIYSGDRIPHECQQEIIDYASKVIFMSEGELSFVRNNIKVPQNKVSYIKNGVSRIFDTELTKGKYVLCVGRIQPMKNQLNLAIACKNLGFDLKYVGEIIDQGYASKVLNTWGEWLPNRPQEELVELYKEAQVVACVSEHDIQPNCVLEGGLSGANIVLTDKSKSFLDGFPNIWICKTDPESIREAVVSAWNAPKNGELKNIFRTWTWEKAATKLIGVYNEVLKSPI